DTFTPLGQDAAPYLKMRGPHPINVAARLRPGVSVAQVQTELGIIGHRLAAQYPDTNKDRSFFAEPMHVDVGEARATLWLLFGAVGLVLLIACANVASLLLARSVSRERELAMRAALGAGRGRLIRQCLTESCVLACLGGALGVALAAIGARPFVKFWPGSLPRADDVQLDWNVLWFALGVSLLSGILFGLVPALRIRARRLEHSLRAGARSVVGGSRRVHGVFVTAEIAIAMVLLVSAGMLGRTLLHLSALNPGLDIHNLLVSRMALAPATLKDPGLMRAAWKEVLERAAQVPGVESAAVVDTVPLRQGENELGYWTSADVPPDNKLPFALATSVTPEYLRVMKIPLLRGRFFNDHDTLDSQPVMVIDDVMAQHAFGRTEVVGKRLWVPDMGPKPFLVAGVVGHVRHWGLAADDQSPVRDQFYYPYPQVPDALMRRWSELTSIVVRTKVNPLSILPTLRKQLRGETGEQVLYEVQTMEQLAKQTLARQRFLMLLFGVFAGLALLLACIGVYGVLAYLTGQRVPEVGLRLALGASARGIQWMVVRQSLLMISAGAAIGLTAAFGAAYTLRQTVAGMQPLEAGTFVLTLVVLMIASLVASFLPARRASRVDPMTALRTD
ncbi:MAG: ABC transporter permease, partial [Acidobacteriaceae bacterium]|nr:ABC transporter permease [Acidobacteriaceae bacterium]